MKFVLENWLPLLAALGCLTMHLFGHGHGNHESVRVKAKKHEPHVERGSLP